MVGVFDPGAKPVRAVGVAGAKIYFDVTRHGDAIDQLFA
jgi:hypothetical protein